MTWRNHITLAHPWKSGASVPRNGSKIGAGFSPVSLSAQKISAGCRSI
jgi:hypothetical protein